MTELTPGRWFLAVGGSLLLSALLLMACGQSEEEKQEARRLGLHCLNLGDTNESFYGEVYASLVDSGSLKEELTVISPVVSGEHRIKMDFTAKNAIGETERHTAIGWVDTETCTASLESIT